MRTSIAAYAPRDLLSVGFLKSSALSDLVYDQSSHGLLSVVGVSWSIPYLGPLWKDVTDCIKRIILPVVRTADAGSRKRMQDAFKLHLYPVSGYDAACVFSFGNKLVPLRNNDREI
jgi:hypothetical protein